MGKKGASLARKVDTYFNDPVIRALVALVCSMVPYGLGSAIDEALRAQYERMRAKRLWTFFEALATGEVPLTEELVQTEEFLHAFFATTKAALNTQREEKIRMFARMLLKGSESGLIGTDEYEELLQVLDDLSLREFCVLSTLKDFENSACGEGPDIQLKQAQSYWAQFAETVQNRCGVPRNELPAFLARLNRTGLYETFTGTYYDYRGGMGRLTPLYDKLAALVIWHHDGNSQGVACSASGQPE